MYVRMIINDLKANKLVSAATFIFMAITAMLLVRLVIWRERSDSSLKKALGFTSSDIRNEYLRKTLLYVLPGILLGIFAGIVPGQGLAAVLLRSMGVYGFRFIIEPAAVFAAAPAVILAVVVSAALVSLLEVNRIRAYECLRGQER